MEDEVYFYNKELKRLNLKPLQYFTKEDLKFYLFLNYCYDYSLPDKNELYDIALFYYNKKENIKLRRTHKLNTLLL